MQRPGVTQFLETFESDRSIFFDISPHLLVVLDERGNIARVNPTFERELNRPEASVLRHGIISYVHSADVAAFIHSFDPAREAGMFRLLRAEHGVVPVRLAEYSFKHTPDGLRGYLVMQKAIVHEQRFDWERVINWSA